MTPETTANVARHLDSLADTEPHRAAVVFPQGRDRQGRVSYTHLTFRQLREDSDRLANAFASIGIQRGDRVALMIPPCLDFFVATFALFKLPAVPVLIDPGMGILRLGRCLAEAEPTAFIGIPKANLARKVLRWGHRTIRITVSTRGNRWLAQHNFASLRREFHSKTEREFPRTQASDSAAILFTSGSTGPAKGAVYTHGVFEKQVEMLKEMYSIQPGEVDLATFPLFALFGPALGMTCIVPDMNPTRPALVDPRKIIEAVENFGVTNLFGSPSLLNRLVRYPGLSADSLASLKRVISAGAPVPSKTVERLQEKLPENTQVHTPYGATEALPVSTIGSKCLIEETSSFTQRGCGICIGLPVSGMDVKIVPISDNPIEQWKNSLALPSGIIGEIVVDGPVVTQSYYRRPDADRLMKIPDPASHRNRHRMGDLAYFDSQGRLWFCGRKSQRVETPTGRLYTIPVEAIFNAHPMVFRSALVGVPAEGRNWPVLCVELEHDYSTHGADIVGELMLLARQHRHTKPIVAVLLHTKFPVDIRHNAKIFREKLAVWAKKQLRSKSWRPSEADASCPIQPPPTFDEMNSEIAND